jgi:hypothetical protein
MTVSLFSSLLFKGSPGVTALAMPGEISGEGPRTFHFSSNKELRKLSLFITYYLNYP